MPKNKLKFLQIGLGSMGKRRIRNLHFHNQLQIIGYDVRDDRRREAEEKYGIKTVEDLEMVPNNDFDAMLISTPPDQHGGYIRMALKLKKHFFVEHPVSADGYREIFNDRSQTIKVPSCTMLFYTPVKIIKKILANGRIGKILAFQYHMGQYLPDWHTYEDYRLVYFSKKATGACREMLPFELIWLNWLMGSQVGEISGRISKISDLDMDADDIIMGNLKYQNGILGNVIIDVISRKPYRSLRIIGSKGVLEWEKNDNLIKLYGAKSKKTKIIQVPKGHAQAGYINEEEMYNDEVNNFLEAINSGKKFPHNFKDSLKVLNVLYALEKADKNRKSFIIKNHD